MSHPWRLTGAFAGLFLLAILCVLTASAQATGYPERRITFVVGFAPGGGVDTFARVLAQSLSAKLGWQIVVENRPGA
ncbi:MAG TPA: tripartite tricarboxylate transporter substrate binding protein BugD, partial [Xanthobacteraceae bacterium]